MLLLFIEVLMTRIRDPTSFLNISTFFFLSSHPCFWRIFHITWTLNNYYIQTLYIVYVNVKLMWIPVKHTWSAHNSEWTNKTFVNSAHSNNWSVKWAKTNGYMLNIDYKRVREQLQFGPWPPRSQLRSCSKLSRGSAQLYAHTCRLQSTLIMLNVFVKIMDKQMI